MWTGATQSEGEQKAFCFVCLMQGFPNVANHQKPKVRLYMKHNECKNVNMIIMKNKALD